MKILLSKNWKVALIQSRAMRREYGAGHLVLSDPPRRGLLANPNPNVLQPYFYLPDAPHKRHGKPGWAVVATRFHGGGIISRHFTREAAERAARRWAMKDCTCGCCDVVSPRELKNLPGTETNDRNGYSPYDLTT